VVRLMVEILQPKEGMTVYDPACGSGGMLLEAFHFMERHKKNPKSLTLYGQEKNLNTWAICKMALFLHDIDDAFIERGDTLLDPKHLSGEKVLKPLRPGDRQSAVLALAVGARGVEARATSSAATSTAARRSPTGTWPSCSTWWLR
jgi:hypothetical protein